MKKRNFILTMALATTLSGFAQRPRVEDVKVIPVGHLLRYENKQGYVYESTITYYRRSTNKFALGTFGMTAHRTKATYPFNYHYKSNEQPMPLAFDANTDVGVFGRVLNENILNINTNQDQEIGVSDPVVGPAILLTRRYNKTYIYNVNITSVWKDKNGITRAYFKCLDPNVEVNLGSSGTPMIQKKRLVGAISNTKMMIRTNLQTGKSDTIYTNEGIAVSAVDMIEMENRVVKNTAMLTPRENIMYNRVLAKTLSTLGFFNLYIADMPKRRQKEIVKKFERKRKA